MNYAYDQYLRQNRFKERGITQSRVCIIFYELFIFFSRMHLSIEVALPMDFSANQTSRSYPFVFLPVICTTSRRNHRAVGEIRPGRKFQNRLQATLS